MALPSNVSYCTVTGRFISAVADGSDAGKEPDGLPVEGLTVQFTASVNPPVVKNVAEQVSIVIAPITCTTDDNGFLLGPDGTPGVMLVASDDPDLDPHGWTWVVTVFGPSFPRVTTSFVAPSDGAVDLATVVPVPASPGAQITQWQAAVSTTTAARDETLAARDETVALIEGFDPGETGGAVASVNGQTGTIVLDAESVGALPDTYEPPAPAWSDVTGKPSTFTPAAHTHTVANVTGLQSALDAKQASGSYAAESHTHTVANVTGLQSALDAKAATSAIPTTPADIGAATLAQGAKADSAVQPAALSSYVPTTRTVAGKALSGNVTLAKGDVGLGNVDNTTDALKPISTATAAALAGKVATNGSVASVNYVDAVEDIPGGAPVGSIWFTKVP